MKNRSAEQKSHDKKGSRVKKSHCKKNRSKFATKNVPCVNSTIEIALERIQRDIAANSRRQNRGEFALCVSRHYDDRDDNADDIYIMIGLAQLSFSTVLKNEKFYYYSLFKFDLQRKERK